MKNCIYKRIKSFFHQYINGTKGAVSLLLALVLSPFLSIALLLVESARYQDAVGLVEEIMDVSAFSSLSDYDSFLDERFGLLSVSQESGINQAFSAYLSENVSALGNSITLNASKGTGKYPLSNTSVLKQQVLEYSEITVASEMLIEGFDIDKVLDQLTESLDLEDVQKEMEAVNATIDVAAEVENLLEAIVDTKSEYENKYVPALSEYRDAYSTFAAKAQNLADTLSAAEESLDEEDSDSVYDDSDVKKAEKELKEARDTYQTKASEVKTSLSDLRDHIDKVFSATAALPEKLKAYDDKTSNGSAVDKCTTSSYEWLLIIIGTITETIDTLIGDDYRNKMNQEGVSLEEQIIKLGNLEDKTITGSWTDEKIASEYGPVSITSIQEGFGDALGGLLSQLDQSSAVSEEEQMQMSQFLDIAGELLGVDGLYSINLDSAVDTTYLYTDTEMSMSSQAIMESITDLIGACEDFSEAISSHNVINSVIKAVKALVKLLKSIVEFLAALILWASDALATIYTYITSGPTEWYNSLLLYGYAAYNLPNRTNYNSGKTLSGYAYSQIFDMAGGVERADAATKALSEFSAIENMSGADKMFKGAEAEYILVGSTSEIMNQSVSFYDLFIFRLICNFIAVLTNQEVSAMAALAGPGSWIVKLAVVLGESLLDTIILVNSEESREYIHKKTFYLSASGISLLMQDLNSITGFNQTLKDKLKDTIIAKKGDASTKDKDKEKGAIDATYKEHLLLLMLLFVNQETYMQRLQNLIQMEAAVKNESQFTFQLSKAYTYIYADVTYTLNPMFNVDSLTENGLFTVTSKRYSGY